MSVIPMNSRPPYSKQTIGGLNSVKITSAKNAGNIHSLNVSGTQNKADGASNAAPQNRAAGTANAAPQNRTAGTMSAAPQNRTAGTARPLPQFRHPIIKGQKVPLEQSGRLSTVSVRFGWNISDDRCDVDVSAFLLGSNGKILGDDWFVFYGQTASPDHSTVFSDSPPPPDRECINIDFAKLHPGVAKIVFVLTIDEALSRGLNFSMLKDAYIRILNPADSHSEIVSFLMTDYYSNVTSMMIGEIYLHQGKWKFNSVGNGVARDLAGLCELYGVEVI